MTKQDFLNEVIKSLGLETGGLKFDTDLSEIDEFDSFTVLALISLIQRSFGIQLKASALLKAPSVGNFVSLIGEERFSDD